jgi:hypothetical protein
MGNLSTIGNYGSGQPEYQTDINEPPEQDQYGNVNAYA